MLSFMELGELTNKNRNQQLISSSCDVRRLSAPGSGKLRTGVWSQNLCAHARQRRNVVQNIRVGGVGQRAMAFMGGNAPPRFFDLFAEPDFLEIVVMVAQVTEI